jgi:geranylgeranyl reductase family protein
VLPGSRESGRLTLQRADVAIVGAGPSGAWTAFLLARKGARVLVLDPSHPREKPCGGGVTGRALALVAHALPHPLPSVAIRRARFLDGSGHSASVDLPSTGRTDALVVSGRAAFDGLLLDAALAAGAELDRSRAIDVRRAPSGFEIQTADGRNRAAAVVVGADGVNSLVRRKLHRPFARRQLSIATGYFAHGTTSDEILLEFVADPPGYIWSFPRPDHLAIGICASAVAGTTSGALRQIAARWIERTRLADNGRIEPYSWPIPSLSAGDLDAVTVAGPQWYLVGDAAGAVDPITREGIFFALQSASFAADAIAGSQGQGERHYAERMRSDIMSELRRAAQLKDTFFQPRFTRLLIDALHRSAPIRSVMADLVAGAQSYRGLKWRLVRTLEIGYAAKAVAALA